MENKEGSSCPTRWLLLAFTAALIFLLLWWWDLLGYPILEGLRKTGFTFGEFIQWRTPEFQTSFWASFRRVLPLWRALFVAGPWRWLLLLWGLSASTAFLTPAWRPWIDGKRCARTLCIGMPPYLGLLLWPLEIKHGFRVLAEVGLTSQHVVAAAIIEPFALVELGVCVSLVVWGTSLYQPRKTLSTPNEAS